MMRVLGYVHTIPDSFSFVPIPIPIGYATLHLGDRRSASLSYRNRAEIIVFMCEQRRYPVWFSRRRRNKNASLLVSSLGREKEGEGELATTSLEFQYLHRKSRCEMLIGGDDFSNDVITLGT